MAPCISYEYSTASSRDVLNAARQFAQVGIDAFKSRNPKRIQETMYCLTLALNSLATVAKAHGDVNMATAISEAENIFQIEEYRVLAGPKGLITVLLGRQLLRAKLYCEFYNNQKKFLRTKMPEADKVHNELAKHKVGSPKHVQLLHDFLRKRELCHSTVGIVGSSLPVC